MIKILKSLPALIIIAIISGIVLGMFLPDYAVRIFVTFKSIFGDFLGFCIPLIIVGLVTAAIGRMGTNINLIFVSTVTLAYLFTIGSGLFAYFSGVAVYPKLLESMTGQENLHTGKIIFSPYFQISMPPLMDVMTALILSFIMGAGIANGKNNKTLVSIMEGVEEIVSKLIVKAIIPFLPLYICSIFVEMSASGSVKPVFALFVKIIIFIFALHILLLFIQFFIAGIISGKNPLKMLWKMMPAYLTALGTQSSAATIPFTLRQTKLNGIDEQIAGFVIPLCATIHLSGSTLKIVSCAMALMIMQSIPFDFGIFLRFILLLGITMVAAPGVPGGAIMAAVAVLQSVLGFGEENIALMIALYITMDSFGTAANITGDGAIAAIIDKINKIKKGGQGEDIKIHGRPGL